MATISDWRLAEIADSVLVIGNLARDIESGAVSVFVIRPPMARPPLRLVPLADRHECPAPKGVRPWQQE